MVKRVEDFDAWRLADELRTQVYALVDTSAADKDWKFRDQLREAMASGLRNFAEGFGRGRDREFAHFLRIARASLFEVSECLRDGVARGYWNANQVEGMHVLAKRSTAAMTRLIRYLDQ